MKARGIKMLFKTEKMNMKLICVFFTIFLVQGLRASKAKFLDEGDDFDVKDVAKKVCWAWSGARNQITKYSTLRKLVEYFESLPAEHELSSCAKNHLKSLKALSELTGTGNEDVCAEEKLSQIERFHHEHFGENYRSHLVELPRVLRAFFYQYASRISNVCATSSYNYFESDLSKITKMPHLYSVIEKGLDQFAREQDVKSYEDLYMIWSLLDRFSKNVHTSMSDYVNGESKRMYVKIPQGDNLKKFQDTCSQSVKPIYSQTILPVLRLIDLGYYPDETEFLSQLVHNPYVNRLYKLTVLCEIMLPVGVISSNSGDNQTYLVKPADVEPLDLDSETINTPTTRFIEPSAMGAVDLLPLGTPDHAFRRCRRIHEDVKSREKSIVKIVKSLVKNMKKKSSYSNVELWETKERIEPMVNEAVEKVDDAESHGRRKRSLKSFLSKSVLVVRNFLYLVMMFIFSVIGSVLNLVFKFFSGIVIGFHDVYSLKNN